MKKVTYSGTEISKLLDIPRRTVTHYFKTGVIPAIQHPITGGWKVTYEDLLAFMEKHQLDSSIISSALDVMIVDDDPTVLDFTRRALDKLFEGIEIETENNGYDAILKLGSHAPDLVILDVFMPRIDGKEVLASIRRGETTQNVKILAISGYPEAIEEMRRLGADAVLAKPFDLKQLIESLTGLFPDLEPNESMLRNLGMIE